MDFKESVWDAINDMKEKHGYNPTIFINMINKHGVIEAVRRLINDPKPSPGLTRLWKLNALHLSMEAIIQEEKWKAIFSEEERMKAKAKLDLYGYKI
jgi:exonuclease I